MTKSLSHRLNILAIILIASQSIMSVNDYLDFSMTNTGSRAISHIPMFKHRSYRAKHEQPCVKFYKLAINSLFKKMRNLLFLPMGQFQMLYIEYFEILESKGRIDSFEFRDLTRLMEDFSGHFKSLFAQPLLRISFTRSHLKIYLKNNSSRYINCSHAFSSDKNIKSQWVKWGNEPNDSLNILQEHYKDNYFATNAEFIIYILKGFVKFFEKEIKKEQNLGLDKILNSYLKRLTFYKLSNFAFNGLIKDFILRKLKNEIHESNPLLLIKRFIDELAKSPQRIHWRPLKQLLQKELDLTQKYSEEELSHSVTKGVLDYLKVSSPQFTEYYKEKMKRLASHFQIKDERSKVFELVFELIKREMFPRFESKLFAAKSFGKFIEGLGISDMSLIIKAFDAYCFELENLNLIAANSKIQMRKLFDDLYKSKQLKGVDDNKENLDSQNILGKGNENNTPFTKEEYTTIASNTNNPIDTQEIYNIDHLQKMHNMKKTRILGDDNDSSGNKQKDSFIGFINAMIGVDMYLIHRSRYRARILWKRYLEFYNLRKKGVIPYHLKTLLRVVRPSSKISGLYKVKALVSHYVDRLENIKLLTSVEKKYLVKIMISIILNGYMRSGKYNMKLAYSRFMDNALRNRIIPPHIIESHTRLHAEKYAGPQHKSIKSNGIFERIYSYQVKQVRGMKTFDSRTFFTKNYKYKNRIKSSIDKIIERLRDHYVERIPKIPGNFHHFLWNKLHDNFVSSDTSQKIMLPLSERVVEYQELKNTNLPLLLVECFRNHAEGIKFNSWSSFQEALKKYVSNLEGLPLTQTELNILKQSMEGLKPFFSFKNIDLGKFLAAYPNQIEIMDEVSDPRKSVFDIFTNLKSVDLIERFQMLKRFVSYGASLYSQNLQDELVEFLATILKSDRRERKLTIDEYSPLLSKIQKSLKETEPFKNEPLSEIAVSHFLFYTPFEAIVRAKSILASCRMIFNYKTEELINAYRANKRTFVELLGYDDFIAVDLLLEKYTNLVSVTDKFGMPTKKKDVILSIYRKSDHEKLKEQLIPGYNDKNRFHFELMINLFNRFSMTLLIMNPLTSFRLKSSLQPEMQFCAHSTKNLSSVFEKIKVNERLAEKKSTLQFVRKHNLKNLKLPFSAEKKFNLYKMLFHLRIKNFTKFSQFLKLYHILFETTKEGSSSTSLKKSLMKFLEKQKMSSFVLTKSDLLEFTKIGDSSKGLDLPTIRKRMFRIFEISLAKSIVLRQNFSSFGTEKIDFNSKITIRKRLYRPVLNLALKSLGMSRPLGEIYAKQYLDKTSLNILKTLYKPLPKLEEKILKFAQITKSVQALIRDEMGAPLRKSCLKFLTKLDLFQKSFLKEMSASPHSKEDDAQTLLIIRKIILRNLPALELVSKKLVKNIHSVNARISDEDEVKKSFVKKLLKSLSALVSIKKTFMKVIRDEIENQSSSTSIEGLRKRLIRQFSRLSDFNLKFYIQFEPKFVKIIGNAKGDTKSIAKRLYKFVQGTTPKSRKFGRGSKFSDTKISHSNKLKSFAKKVLKFLYNESKEGQLHYKRLVKELMAKVRFGKTEDLSNILKSKLFRFVSSNRKVEAYFVRNFKGVSSKSRHTGANEKDGQIIRSKVYKFLGLLQKGLLRFEKNTNLLYSKGTSVRREGNSSFMSKISKRVYSKSAIISVFNKTNLAKMLKKQGIINQTHLLKSKGFHFIPGNNRISSLVNGPSTLIKMKTKTTSDSGLNSMKSQIWKTVYNDKVHSLHYKKQNVVANIHGRSENKASSFKTELVKYILMDDHNTLIKKTVKSSSSISNSAQNKANLFKSSMLKPNSFLHNVMIKYLKTRISSRPLIKKIKKDIALKSIIFNLVLNDQSQKAQFTRFVSNLIKSTSILPLKNNLVSQKILFKQLESLNIQKEFLRYISENHDPQLASQLLRTRSIPNNRIKFEKVIKLFADLKMQYKHKKYESPIQKLKIILHDFGKSYKEHQEGSNRMGEGDLEASIALFVNRMSKLMMTPNEFGRISLGKLARVQESEPPEVAKDEVIYSCCTTYCQEGTGSDCANSEDQNTVNNDDKFLQRTTEIININPIVNIHIKVRDDQGNLVDREMYTIEPGNLSPGDLQNNEALDSRLI
jgi:hypothetical protein